MAPINSLDEFSIIAALLHDVFYMFGDVFSIRARRNTLNKVSRRTHAEGLSFLTKSLPKLGKAFDRALTGSTKLTATELRLKPMSNSELPSFLGELFSLVFQPDGKLLPQPNVRAVGVIRQVCYLFYKYELPYSVEQENAVISQFIKTENDLSTVTETLETIRGVLNEETSTYIRRKSIDSSASMAEVAREARILLSRVFSSFDPYNITPRHGPGAVATKQKLWDKFKWTNVSSKITQTYPLDEYFYASLGHVCDQAKTIQSMPERENSARVILVPKDSRGPRLISCEPVDYQWIQQGLGKAIVDWLEGHPITKWNVNFTSQEPNQFGALLGSKTGKYVTLDLKEASDRISLSLVRLLFPDHLYRCMESCRTSTTELPNKDIIPLLKFAPMGSSLCFPILATTIWAILSSSAPDEDTRKSILVYGDDVIVPTAFAEDAMKRLEAFGLLVNRDKSCTSGLFRESCGTDAFQGINVTPVRLRTVWSSEPSPSVYTSWVAYANSLRRKQYYTTYDKIAGALHHIYGRIPATDMLLTCPSLDEVPEVLRPNKKRTNHSLQKTEWCVRDVRSKVLSKVIDGWSMLLRVFTESARPTGDPGDLDVSLSSFDAKQAFSASQYTRRDTTGFVRVWKSAEKLLSDAFRPLRKKSFWS
jgi:hypothetical protein